MFTRARAALACLALLAAPALAGCGDDPAQEKDRPAATDWTPAPEKVDGLSVLAASDKDGFRLHTASGDKTFLPGVNLGSTTPLHQPGEVGTIEAEHYQRWFDEMGDLGIRVVRIYTLHPPAFYDELAAYNQAHADAPLYLVQGAYLPNEEYNQPGRSLYDADIDGAFRAEIKDLSDAVHGDLVRKPAPGRAGGTYGTDVSAWLLSWIIGVEWDPPGVLQTDTAEKDRPYEPGTYFAATDDASAHRALDRHAHGRRRRARGEARHLGAGRDGQLADRRPARATPTSRWPARTSPASTPTTCCPPTPGPAAPSPASTPTPTTRTSSATSPGCRTRSGTAPRTRTPAT